ncbi:MAG: heterodisulfide reductase [Deltaproteobacteria bacterium]|nr:heterodisulfide reductase [Deltaproteobacteria bacterium]
MKHFSNPISEQDRVAIDKIAEISGENVYRCMQCGTCSAVCPMGPSMTITVRQGMHLLQLRRVEEVVDAKIGDFCAACHTCSVRCPRDIDVAKVYEAVRQIAVRQNVDIVKPEDIPKETMAEAPQIAFVSGFRKLTA